MGRAIDMERDLDILRSRVDKIDAALEKVINVVDELQNKGTDDSKKQHKSKTKKESAKESV
jgi:hypothetical protein